MQDIRTRLANASKRKNYNFILAQNLSPKTASHLKELAKKLYVQGFFKAFSNDNNRVETRGLSIIEHKEDRIYMSKDALTPAIGYTRVVLDEESKILNNRSALSAELLSLW